MNKQQLASKIWESANKMRSKIEANEYKDYIIGRMGIPYKAKHVCLVSIAIDAPEKTIGALGGKLGRIRGLTVKTAYSRI